jgi:hypothetical protein
VAWASTSTEALSFNEYRIRIQETILFLKSGKGDIGPDEIFWLKEKFPPALKVRWSKSETIQVNRKDLIPGNHMAHGRIQDRDRLITHFEALLRQMSMANGTPSFFGTDWEQYRMLLEEVYRDSQFKHLHELPKPRWKDLVERFFKALGTWLREHLNTLGPISGKWIEYLVHGIILFLGGILIVLFIRFLRTVGWNRKQTGVDHVPSFTLPERDWTFWREDAHKKALEGSFREAIRSLFVSVLMEGHQLGWWIYKPEATNKEHLARVDGQSQRSQVLRKLVTHYEKAWYGLGNPGKQEYRDCEEWVRQMESLA